MGQGRQGLGREGRLIVRRAYRQTGVTRTEILTATRRRDGRRRETGGRLLEGAPPACRSAFVYNGNLAHRKSHVRLPRHGAFHRADSSAGRREPRRRVFGRARHVRPTDGSLLRTRGLRARPRRRVARLGSAGPDVHRLRRRRRSHLAWPLPPGDGQGFDRASAHALARLELDDQRAGAAAGEKAGRRDLCRTRFPVQLRRRSQRGRAQARAPLRARSLRAGKIPGDLDA